MKETSIEPSSKRRAIFETVVPLNLLNLPPIIVFWSGSGKILKTELSKPIPDAKYASSCSPELSIFTNLPWFWSLKTENEPPINHEPSSSNSKLKTEAEEGPEPISKSVFRVPLA
ncbi:hypothetical protein D3C86_1749260 [compost metagenome]